MTGDQSRTAQALRAVENLVTRASEGSRLIGGAESVADRVAAVVRNSYAYHWLTAEPEPDVIVVDLRETRTVGPFVRLLETVLEPVERAWADSRLASITTAISDTQSRSRTGQLLAALLEPPEPLVEERDEERE